MSKHFQLPEKEHFSIQEISERWGCEASRVKHYIYDMRTLRPTVMPEGFDLPTEKIIFGLPDKFFFNDEANEADFSGLPKYLYVQPVGFPDRFEDRHSADSSDWYFIFNSFKDFAGEAYFLAEVDNLFPPDKKEITYNPHNFRVRATELVITREERDRFESEHTLTQENEQSHDEITRLQNNITQLRAENTELKNNNEQANSDLSERGEVTYLNIIGAMLKLFTCDTPFKKQSAIIAALEELHKGKQGISKRSLEDKFALANRQLEKTGDV